MGQHALLSPSKAHRWLNCTPSALLEDKVPDTPSPYALEGTLAHAICAGKLRDFLGLPTEAEEKEIAGLSGRWLTPEMAGHTDTYTTIVLERFTAARAATPDARLLVEVRLDLGDLVPGAFGTADAVIIADGCMEIIDFKYGKGVRVEAEKNPQLMIYALGALRLFDMEYDISQVRMTIVQPRLGHLSEYVVSAERLDAWREFLLTPKAAEAAKGEGVQRPGDWCRFCKVSATCRALATKAIATYSGNSDFLTIQPERMATEVLPALPLVKAWANAVEEGALHAALDGTKFPGYKLVAGRSVRRITDPEKVAETLGRAGFSDDDILKPAELRGLGELERLVGKKHFTELCSPWIVKPQGAPALVPMSDKRPALNSAAEDFKD